MFDCVWLTRAILELFDWSKLYLTMFDQCVLCFDRLDLKKSCVRPSWTDACHVSTESVEAKMYETEFDVLTDPTQTGYISAESTIAKLCLNVFDPSWLYFDQSNWTPSRSTNSTEAKYVWLCSIQACIVLTDSTWTEKGYVMTISTDLKWVWLVQPKCALCQLFQLKLPKFQLSRP